MGFRGKMTNRVYAVIRKHGFHLSGVADVPIDEPVLIRIFFRNGFEVFHVSGIGELVHVHHKAFKFHLIQKITDEIRADESAASGHHEPFHFPSFCRVQGVLASCLLHVKFPFIPENKNPIKGFFMDCQ